MIIYYPNYDTTTDITWSTDSSTVPPNPSDRSYSSDVHARDARRKPTPERRCYPSFMDGIETLEEFQYVKHDCKRTKPHFLHEWLARALRNG